MKKYILLLALTLASVGVSAQDFMVNQIFSELEDMPGVTSITIGKPMFDLVKNMDISNDKFAQMKPIMENANSLRMLIIEKTDVEAKKADVVNKNIKEIQEKIRILTVGNQYSEMLNVSNEDAKIRILAKSMSDDVIGNPIINIDSEDTYMLLIIDGDVSMEAIKNLMDK